MFRKARKITTVALLALSIVTVIACSEKDEGWSKLVLYDETPHQLELYTIPPPNIPADNPLTLAKVRLGKMLFFDQNLSADGTVSCASCHLQEHGFSDPNRFSEGVGGAQGSRQAMAIFNLLWHDSGFFWDGRAALLRHQALLPIQDPLEMDESLENVIEKLSADYRYRDQFIRAFDTDEITPDLIALALENFMYTIVSDNSKYDQWIRGEVQLTDSEERGRILFFAEYNEFFPTSSGADCFHCHGGPNFDNAEFFNNGLDDPADMTDLGREYVTGDPNDRGKFKVPSLRNIALTAPYMHDGRFETLEEVIDHYNNGLHYADNLPPHLEITMGTGLMLDTFERRDLINFLKTLTDYTYLENEAYHPID